MLSTCGYRLRLFGPPPPPPPPPVPIKPTRSNMVVYLTISIKIKASITIHTGKKRIKLGSYSVVALYQGELLHKYTTPFCYCSMIYVHSVLHAQVRCVTTALMIGTFKMLPRKQFVSHKRLTLHCYTGHY